MFDDMNRYEKDEYYREMNRRLNRKCENCHSDRRWNERNPDVKSPVFIANCARLDLGKAKRHCHPDSKTDRQYLLRNEWQPEGPDQIEKGINSWLDKIYGSPASRNGG